jgi:hypothetical protein
MGIASLHPSYALMKIRKRFHREEDGEFISAAIYSGEEELLVHDRRVGFVAGTAPDDKQKTMNVGECMLVLGIPRIDLALVSWRIRHGGDALRARWDHASLSSDILFNIAHAPKNRQIRTLSRATLRDHGAPRRISGPNPSKRIRGQESDRRQKAIRRVG